MPRRKVVQEAVEKLIGNLEQAAVSKVEPLRRQAEGGQCRGRRERAVAWRAAPAREREPVERLQQLL